MTDQPTTEAEPLAGWCECCERAFEPVGFRPGDRRTCPTCQRGLVEFQDEHQDWLEDA